MEESRITATQTMEVVYGLFNNMKVVMDGTDILLDISAQHPESLSFQMERRQLIISERLLV